MTKNKIPKLFRAHLFMLLFVIFMSFSSLTLVSAATLNINKIPTAAKGSFTKLNEKWIYQYSNGKRAQGCFLKIQGKIYYFSAYGYRQCGWKKIENYHYYFGTFSQGYMYRKRWLKKGDDIYYLHNSGRRAKGFTNIDNNTYYFDPDTGIRQYGFQTINGKKYYFGSASSGIMYKNKFARISNQIYYFDSDGQMVTGWQTINGYDYYFNRLGQAYRGTHQMKGIPHHFSSTGKLISTGASLSVKSNCAILVDASSGEVLFAQNADLKHANASTTKIMTCILALENSKMSEIVKTSSYAASIEPSKMYFSAGESFRMKDMLYSLMLPSHNDTAVAIAEHISGTETEFVKKMNKKAKVLGCKNTNFATPNGLDAGYNHYTTARDLSLIARHALKSNIFRQIIKTPTYTYKNTDGKKYYIASTNRLLINGVSGVCGMKTGYTDKAGHCFVCLIKAKNGKEYISVILGGPDSNTRWSDSETLAKFAYNYN